MPEHLSDITPGGKANADFVAAMQEKYSDQELYSDLVGLIPNRCIGCSSAWSHVDRNQVDKLLDCPGREEVTTEFAGKLVVQHFCHLPTGSEK